MSLLKIKYSMKRVIIIAVKEGTIKEFISIRPLVFFSKVNSEINTIIDIPTHLDTPKYWWSRAPLPARIIPEPLTRKNPVIISVTFPKKPGLTRVINSL